MPADDLRHRVMRLGKTEPPFTGRYLEHRERGQYRCGQCAALLFTYRQKFHSGCGWPSFLEACPGVEVRPDPRVEDAQEAVCRSCQGHLGHLFGEDHYCINSIALDFEPLEASEEEDEEPDYLGRYPLARAASRGDLELMQSLVRQGALLEAHCPRKQGITALHEACLQDQRAAADWLGQQGADPDFAIGLNASPRELKPDWFQSS